MVKLIYLVCIKERVGGEDAVCGRSVGGRLRGVPVGEDGLLSEDDDPVILGPEDGRGQERPQVLGGHVQRHQPHLKAPGAGVT